MRTARSRSSGEYLFVRGIGSILSRKEPSDKPGTIQLGVIARPSLIIGATSISTISSLELLQ